MISEAIFRFPTIPNLEMRLALYDDDSDICEVTRELIRAFKADEFTVEVSVTTTSAFKP